MYKMYAAQIGTKLRLLLLVMMIVQLDENIYQSYYHISVPKDAQLSSPSPNVCQVDISRYVTCF